MQGQKEFRILLPIFRVVRRIGPEPESELQALLAGRCDDGFESVGETDGIHVPETRKIPPGTPASLLTWLQRGRIGRAPLLPSVVDLDDVDTQFRTGRDLLHEEGLVDARITVAVAPGVRHEDSVAPRDIWPELTLEIRRRANASEASALVCDFHTRFGARKDSDATDRIDMEVHRLHGARMRERCRTEVSTAASGERILPEDRRGRNIKRLLVGRQQIFRLKDKLVMRIRIVLQPNDDNARMNRRFRNGQPGQAARSQGDNRCN